MRPPEHRIIAPCARPRKSGGHRRYWCHRNGNVRARERQEHHIMGRLRQVSKAEATPEIQELYQQFFGDRDPVAEPGTATGTPGDYWTTFALVPDVLAHAIRGFQLYGSPARVLDRKLRE